LCSHAVGQQPTVLLYFTTMQPYDSIARGSRQNLGGCVRDCASGSPAAVQVAVPACRYVHWRPEPIQHVPRTRNFPALRRNHLERVMGFPRASPDAARIDAVLTLLPHSPPCRRQVQHRIRADRQVCREGGGVRTARVRHLRLSVGLHHRPRSRVGPLRRYLGQQGRLARSRCDASVGRDATGG